MKGRTEWQIAVAKELGAYLQRHRALKGLSTNEVAKRSDNMFTQSWVVMVENGLVDSSYIRIVKYANILGVPLPGVGTGQFGLTCNSVKFEDDEIESEDDIEEDLDIVEVGTKASGFALDELRHDLMGTDSYGTTDKRRLPSELLVEEAHDIFFDDDEYDEDRMNALLDLAIKFDKLGM